MTDMWFIGELIQKEEVVTESGKSLGYYLDFHIDTLFAGHPDYVTEGRTIKYKFISTVKKIKDELCRDGLMYRYKNQDDFGKPSSSFTVCTFWLIKSLYRIGEKEEAKKMFNNILKYSNHLGLYSEGMDFDTKRLLGNFPQAYSHLALIDTALTLSDYQLRKDTVIEDVLN